MLKEFVLNHMVMSSILFVGALSLALQLLMTLSLKGYVKASANMKTTKKKIMLNLKNQFETIYGMNYQVHNAAVYVDKYLLKLRFLGMPYSVWERVPFLTAGIVTLLAVGGEFYEYVNNAKIVTRVEILFAYVLVLACLFVCFHIFGIKSGKQQIQIQLVDYLENYLSNRLTRLREDNVSMDLGELEESGPESEEMSSNPEMEEDMMMLKRMLSQMEKGKSRAYTKMQAEKEKKQELDDPELQGQQIAAGQEADLDEINPEMADYSKKEQSDLELLEEFVQSFLA